MPEIMQMIGKEVEVIANGMSYRGTLIEVSETEVHLRTSLQWIALPASSVSVVKLAEVRSFAPPPAPTANEPEEVEEVGDELIIEDPEGPGA